MEGLRVINLLCLPQLRVHIYPHNIESFTPDFSIEGPSNISKLRNQALSSLFHASVVHGLLSLCFLGIFLFKLSLLLLVLFYRQGQLHFSLFRKTQASSAYFSNPAKANSALLHTFSTSDRWNKVSLSLFSKSAWALSDSSNLFSTSRVLDKA